jgi:hypothetical protein
MPAIARRHCRRRRCSLGPEGYLGLLLFYLGSTLHYKYLCLIFGRTPSICSRVITWMLRKMVRLLRNHLIAMVQFPNNAKMKEYADMIQAREPLVKDVIGFIDSISFPTECTDKRVEQNAYYCCYKCDTMVNNVFVYGPDVESCWADGSLTAPFFHKMKRRIRAYKICVDQGFPQCGEECGTFIGLVTKRAAWRLHCYLCDFLLCISNMHTSLWQASDWGMPGLQGTFPWCKKRFPSDNAMRRLVIEAIVSVQIFQTDYVGYKYMKTILDLEYVCVENLQGYDLIAHYYFHPGDYDSEVEGSGSGSDESDED